jgi:DNA-binding transcriptional ArsR family regulator
MEIKAAIAALQSLAQETRLEVFRLLVRAGKDGLPAGEIGEALDVPAPTLSFHLNHLSNAGLVERRRVGRSIWYTVRFDGFGRLMEYLMENCCQGRLEIMRSMKERQDVEEAQQKQGDQI